MIPTQGSQLNEVIEEDPNTLKIEKEQVDKIVKMKKQKEAKDVKL